jgi:phage-related minor tail protein
MEAHGIGDHGSIVGEVEGGYESQVVAVVAQVVAVVAQVVAVVAQVVAVVAQVVAVVAQVVVVVAQVVAEEDLVEYWILRKWTNGNTLGGNPQTPELRR